MSARPASSQLAVCALLINLQLPAGGCIHLPHLPHPTVSWLGSSSRQNVSDASGTFVAGVFSPVLRTYLPHNLLLTPHCAENAPSQMCNSAEERDYSLPQKFSFRNAQATPTP